MSAMQGIHRARPSKTHLTMIKKGLSVAHGTKVGGYNPSHHQLLKKANYALHTLPAHPMRKIMHTSQALAYSPISAATKTRQ